ncbi:S66 family peptidase [Clostridium felsineum]|uniref:Microcin C7 self-immunity protein MccF n=1 Tax=Clostridium felsineum TaxID=36839 RepID=A0A1S8L7A8_9CLOT|nr:S66 peptidase family protein [Clostridium felsineum]URZ07113.1 Microcin C7 self-immunity protein MccF [Clostridium felsineum]URZ12143.1 Microcin C7 self-immunity protein MccF [Clostridium felsineum]
MEFRFKRGDKVALISCSDGINIENKSRLYSVVDAFKLMGIECEISKCIFRKKAQFSGTGAERAEELMSFFKSKDIKAIFDVSGGNSANQILDYLDFDIIKNNPKPYFGMSDLTVVLNSLYKKIGFKGYHYAVYNFGRENASLQRQWFEKSFIEGKKDIFDFKYKWLRKGPIEGEVIGGNIRCFLKLAGTEYFVNPEGKVLLLEAMGGNVSNIASLMEQLSMLRYFDKLSGIILGTFSEVQRDGNIDILQEIILEKTEKFNVPIIKTEEIGHGSNSKCIIIGEKIKII